MKKLILSLMAASVAATSFAHGGIHLRQGDILVYGTVGYGSTGGTTTTKFGTANSNTTDNDKVQTWNISPGVGYNLQNNWTIGIDGFYSNTKITRDRDNITVPGVNEYKNYDFGIGVFARHTMPIGQHFYCFAQANAHYLGGRQSRHYVTAQTGGDTYTADDNYKGFDVSVYPAIGINITRSLGMNFSIGSIGYTYKNWDYSTQGMPPGSNMEGKENNFNFTFGRQFNIGIQKTFGCRKHHGSSEPMDDMRRIDSNDDESDHKH